MIKSIFLITLVSIMTIKLIDISLGFFQNSKKSISIQRYINLKEHKPYTDESYKPDIDVRNSDKAYRLRIDKNGFIKGPLLDEELDLQNDQTDILFLGGSTTECIYIDEDKRFPYLLSKKCQ